jgi:hypothetical protein
MEQRNQLSPMAAVAGIVVLSLVIAAVLFGVLHSTGAFHSSYGEFGGAAAGFFASFLLLKSWYDKLSKSGDQAGEIDRLRAELAKTEGPPNFEVPPSFLPYKDSAHSMALCYPADWVQEPMEFQIQAVFAEAKSREGDDFRGNFNVAIASAGKRAFTLKEVVQAAAKSGIAPEKVYEELGVQLSDKTESLQIPAERILPLFGAKGDNRRMQIYNLNEQSTQTWAGKAVRRDIEIVDGIESLSLEYVAPSEQAGKLSILYVITYVEETDLVFTFTFMDNLQDRDKLDLIRRKVMSTVRFWNRQPGQRAVNGTVLAAAAR